MARTKTTTFQAGRNGKAKPAATRKNPKRKIPKKAPPPPPPQPPKRKDKVFTVKVPQENGAPFKLRVNFSQERIPMPPEHHYRGNSRIETPRYRHIQFKLDYHDSACMDLAFKMGPDKPIPCGEQMLSTVQLPMKLYNGCSQLFAAFPYSKAEKNRMIHQMQTFEEPDFQVNKGVHLKNHESNIEKAWNKYLKKLRSFKHDDALMVQTANQPEYLPRVRECLSDGLRVFRHKLLLYYYKGELECYRMAKEDMKTKIENKSDIKEYLANEIKDYRKALAVNRLGTLQYTPPNSEDALSEYRQVLRDLCCAANGSDRQVFDRLKQAHAALLATSHPALAWIASLTLPETPAEAVKREKAEAKALKERAKAKKEAAMKVLLPFALERATKFGFSGTFAKKVAIAAYEKGKVVELQLDFDGVTDKKTRRETVGKACKRSYWSNCQSH